MKKYWFASAILLFAHAAFADISVTDKVTTLSVVAQHRKTSNKVDRAAVHAANLAKRAAKRARHGHGIHTVVGQQFRLTPNATGSLQLVDAGGLKYFINTDITFSSSSSASGAASEASYTAPIVASTSGGGTTMSTPSDAFDGYNGLCVSLTNATGPCQTGNANYTMYERNNAPAVVDATVPAVPECTNRQYVFPVQTIGGLSVNRKVYVPTNDRFIRWMNFYTNTTGAPITFTTITSNNLGSDSNTRIVSSSSGDNVVTTSDLWATTFQNYSGNTTSDPRLGHILQGTGAPTPVSIVNFADGDDNPFWGYSITLNPGQTKIIVNYATALGTKAAANAQSAAIATFGTTARQCMSTTELSQVTNFLALADLSITKTSNTPLAFGTYPVSYTISVTNNGPATAASISVSDTIPAGSGFVSATGTGWTCGFAAGTVTCTMPTLAVGPASPITLTITAPPVVAPGTLSNTATVTAATTDPTPANNSSTAAIPIQTGANAPAMSGWMLALLAVVLAGVVLVRRA